MHTQDGRPRNAKKKTQPKAESAPGTATGTHSTENYQQNQALFEQQALQNQEQEQQSDHSAKTYQGDQPDWGGQSY